MNSLNSTKHSIKMWGCVAFAVIAIVLIADGVGPGALFIVPCMVMMGAMMWMMMGGIGGMGSGPPRSKPEGFRCHGHGYAWTRPSRER